MIAESGLIVAGRGEPVMITLTAPGIGVHFDRRGQACPCTPEGGVSLAEWNALLPLRWNRFCQDLKRLGLRLQYFRAIEVQKRGALHEHLLVVPIDPTRRTVFRVGQLRALAMKHGYGHEIRVERIWSTGGAAGYVAKYVSKTCDDRPDVPWLDRETGELIRARYRPWSASRQWGQRMRDVRDAQRAWARARSAPLDSNTESYTTQEDTHFSTLRDRAGPLIAIGGEQHGTPSEGTTGTIRGPDGAED